MKGKEQLWLQFTPGQMTATVPKPCAVQKPCTPER